MGLEQAGKTEQHGDYIGLLTNESETGGCGRGEETTETSTERQTCLSYEKRTLRHLDSEEQQRLRLGEHDRPACG